MIDGLIQHPHASAIDSDGYPLAYFITFRCYGTWLHGDTRGSVDPQHNQPGEPLMPESQTLQRLRYNDLKHRPMTLGSGLRSVVDSTLRSVCNYKGWNLHALKVLCDHVHVVVNALSRPEPVMTCLKAWSTRRLRESGLIAKDARVWSRHGSTRYLWTCEAIEDASVYTLEAQG